jgi:hypothetical protein
MTIGVLRTAVGRAVSHNRFVPATRELTSIRGVAGLRHADRLSSGVAQRQRRSMRLAQSGQDRLSATAAWWRSCESVLPSRVRWCACVVRLKPMRSRCLKAQGRSTAVKVSAGQFVRLHRQSSTILMREQNECAESPDACLTRSIFWVRRGTVVASSSKKRAGPRALLEKLCRPYLPANLSLILLSGATLLVRVRVPPETWTTRLGFGGPACAHKLLDHLCRLVTN